MSGQTVADAKDELRRNFDYCAALSVGPDYLSTDQQHIVSYQKRIHAEIVAGTRQVPDPRTDGTIDWATQVQLGLIPMAAVLPPPPASRHLAVVFRGTGGIIGEDYVSRVCQGAADLVEEINPPWAATMGGLPVGTAGGIGDPSMSAAVASAFAAGQQTIVDALRVNPKRQVVIGGYSAGAVVAALLRQWLEQTYPGNYLCSFSLGDPTRPAGGCFYKGVDPGGQGISDWHYGDITDWRHCWLTNVSEPNNPDMYACTPLGTVGQIMEDAYVLVTKFSFSDILAATMTIVQKIPDVAEHSGIAVPPILASLSNGIPSLLGLGLPLLLGALGGLVGTGNPDTLTGTAAAAKAALIGITFAASGTRPHISYHTDEVWPGQTYLGLAIQHVRDWSSRATPAVA